MKKPLNDFSTYDHPQLIKKCINGDRQSQKMLYDLYSGKMFKICSGYTSDKKEAEMMLHDGFVSLFQNLPDFNFNVSFEEWAQAIFVNAAVESKFKDQP